MKTTVNIRFLVLIFFVCLTSNFSLHAQTNDSAYLIGKYKLKKIVDGDTFNFENLSKSTRLVCLDTEEIYKGKKAEENTLKISEKWPDFYYEKKGDSKMPVKSNSPFGYAAYMWANKFMSGVDSVILEIDDNERTTDLYDRTLVYVIIEKNNERINYNLECVRNGYSPYFSKYGYSKRFHNDFVEAQNEAIEFRRGIWDTLSKCYPDYNVRLPWWETRALQLQDYEIKHSGDRRYFNLMNRNYSDLELYLDSEIIIFGTISDTLSFENRFVFVMPNIRGKNLDLVIYIENFDILEEINTDSLMDYYIYARGKLKKNSERYYIKIRYADQIWKE